MARTTSTRMLMRRNKTAFSLVELSIVLVILGLLVGGILAGQSLIRASELRSVGADLTKYQTTTLAFKDKYFTLPGDMANAVRFWGAHAGATTDGYNTTCAQTLSSAAGIQATCNGDGDGRIGYHPTDNRMRYEQLRLWQHLANASLLETGNLSGVVPGNNAHEPRGSIPGLNVPAARINNVGYTYWYGGNITGTDGNVISVGATWVLSGTPLETTAPAFTAAEIWNIDTKTDDSLPNTGKLRAAPWNYFGLAYCQTGSGNNLYDLSGAQAHWSSTSPHAPCWFNFYPLQ